MGRKIKINKNNASLVAEWAEPLGDILRLHGPLQGLPGGHHLSPAKALAECLQGSSTNLGSHSIWYPLPFPTNASCPPPGVHTIIWTHLSGQRAATSLAQLRRGGVKGKREHRITQGTPTEAHPPCAQLPHHLHLEVCWRTHHHTFPELFPSLATGFPDSGGSSKYLCPEPGARFPMNQKAQKILYGVITLSAYFLNSKHFTLIE